MNEGKGYRGPRLSRRRMVTLAGVGGAGLAAASVLGCGREERPAAGPEVSAVKQPKRGGIVNSGTSSLANTAHFDPHVDTPIAAQQMRMTYQGLLLYEPGTYEIGPELAQRWEQPSETEYIFTLQPNVRWHNRPPVNGRALTVEDVVLSLERARLDNPRFTSASLIRGVKIEAVDRSRVKLTTPEPDVAFLVKLSSDAFLTLAPEVLEQAGATREPAKLTRPEMAIGTGAFMVQSLEEPIRVEFVRNPDYWKPGLPYLDGIRGQYFPDYQNAYAAFLAGQLDIVLVPGTEAQKFLARQGPDYKPYWAKETGSLVFVAPNTKIKPFDDTRVTRALRLLIDHDEFRTAWADGFIGRGAHASFFPPALDSWDLPEEELKKFIFWQQPKDAAIREALALLSAAGFTRSNPLKFETMGRGATTEGKVAAELIQGQFRRYSQGVVDTELRLLDNTAYQAARGIRDYVYSMMSNAASYVEPDGWFQQCYRSNATRNYWGNSDPKLDAMIDRQKVIFDSQQRKALIREILVYMIENSPGIIPTRFYKLNGVNPRLQNFAPEAFVHGQQYERLWLDT